MYPLVMHYPFYSYFFEFKTFLQYLYYGSLKKVAKKHGKESKISRGQEQKMRLVYYRSSRVRDFLLLLFY